MNIRNMYFIERQRKGERETDRERQRERERERDRQREKREREKEIESLLIEEEKCFKTDLLLDNDMF